MEVTLQNRIVIHSYANISQPLSHLRAHSIASSLALQINAHTATKEHVMIFFHL